MTELARITKHPADAEVVLVHTPPDLSAELGKFGPARYSRDHRAYLLHHDHIPALYRFARRIGLHVTDERSTPGARTLPVECARCAQPGRMSDPPSSCPACGEPWVGVPPPVTTSAVGRHECPNCKHKQNGRFPFCSVCGARMEYPEPAVAPTIPRPAAERPKLADPMLVGEVMRDAVIAQQAVSRGRVDHPAVYQGRRVEDVNLPEPRDEDAPVDEPPPDDQDPSW